MGISECYGTRQNKKECPDCEAKKDCREAAKLNTVPKQERINNEVALALQEFAELPEVYEDYNSKRYYTYDAVLRVVSFLARLSAPALRILRLKLSDPETTKGRIAQVVKLKEATVKRTISDSPVLRELFSDKEQNRGDALIRAGATVYLSGPISGMSGREEAVFTEADEELTRRYSCFVINPIYACNYIGFQRPEADYMLLSAASVKIADVIVLMPGWEISAGSQTEKALAEKLGKQIFTLSEVLQ